MRTVSKGFVGLLTLLVLVTMGSGYLWAQVPQPLGASVPIKLTISATATVQGDANGGDPIDKIVVKTTKITPESILAALAAAEGTTFPSKSALYLRNSSFLVCSDAACSDGGYDVSGYFNVGLDTGGTGGVWSGQVNHLTGAESYTGYYSMYISYGDDVTQWVLSGHAKEKLTMTAVNSAKSSQTISDSISVTCFGDGLMDGAPASLTGTISGSGKMTLSTKASSAWKTKAIKKATPK
jgi:hypothetical protein